MPLGIYPRSDKTHAERRLIFARFKTLFRENMKEVQDKGKYIRSNIKIRKEALLQAWKEFKLNNVGVNSGESEHPTLRRKTGNRSLGVQQVK